MSENIAASDQGYTLVDYAPAFKAAFGVTLPELVHPKMPAHENPAFTSPKDRGIPLDCHPSSITNHLLAEKAQYEASVAAGGTPKDTPLLDGPLLKAVGPAARAMASIHTSWASIIDAESQMGETQVIQFEGEKKGTHFTRNVQVVAGADEAKMAAAVNRVHDRVMKEITGALDVAMQGRAAIDNEIEKALRPASRHNQTLEAELRSDFKADKTAMSFLTTKASLQEIAAVLNAPARLSGLTDENMAQLQLATERRFAGRLIEARAQGERSYKALMHAQRRFQDFCTARLKALEKGHVKAIQAIDNLR